MAGTLTVTRDPRRMPSSGRLVERISIAWTSTAGGAADVEIDNLYGYLVKVVTDPDGTDVPTANYDITLIDENSVDAAESLLINRSDTLTQTVYPVASGATTPVFLCGTHTFTVANAGASKSGVCVLYVVEAL